jgi:hypothetical protein
MNISGCANAKRRLDYAKAKNDDSVIPEIDK